MRFAVIYAQQDTAGTNIATQLKNLYLPHVPLIELKTETIHTDIYRKDFPQLTNIDFLVFASQHRSKDNKPALTIHAPGNPRNADFGGKPGILCPTNPLVLKYLFQQLHLHAKNLSTYPLTLEATHHGPLTDIPCCFVELGATKKEFTDETAADALAQTIASLSEYRPNKKFIPTIAIGGPHYAPNYVSLQRTSPYAIGHILAKYHLPLTESMLTEAEAKTVSNVQEILLDWKGLGNKAERDKTLKTIKDAGLSYRKTSDVKK